MSILRMSRRIKSGKRKSYRSFQAKSFAGASYGSSISQEGEDESSESEPEIESDDQLKPFHVRLLNRLEKIEASNLPFNPVDPGIWDEWGVYYCSSRFGRHTRFTPYAFAIAAILVVGQNNFFALINLMHENGGAAFVVILVIVYASFGYPMYMMETLMGQYSGHKPVLMARLMMPALSGLGVLMYIRTLIRAIGAVGHFSISLYICWDSLFCKGADSLYLKKIATQESQHKRFEIFQGLAYPYFKKSQEDLALDKWMIFMCSLIFILCVKKLKDIGIGIKVIFRMLFIMHFAFAFSAYTRTKPTLTDGQTIELPNESLVYLPFYLAFHPDWWKLIDGMAWVRAMTFVLDSLELGTLAYPYLGAKNFFHYRCNRDGVYLMLVAIVWNLLGVAGVLLWLGYVGISKDEITNAFHEFQGHHGLFVVFVMKFLQCEMTQRVEADIMFFVALFYFIMGTTALLSSLIYMYIMIDCSYSESGHPLMKLIIMAFYIILFVFILFPLMISDNGMRHMMFIDFYGSRPWVGFFCVICFSVAVAWSHGVGRLLYDFFNIIHLKGYEVRTHYYNAPKIFAFLYVGCLIFAMITTAADNPVSVEGPTDWTDPTSRFVGAILVTTPVLAVIIGAIHYIITDYRVNKRPILSPHRDFFKNKHHISVCFKDYQYFTPGIKSKKRRRSSVRW